MFAHVPPLYFFPSFLLLCPPFLHPSPSTALSDLHLIEIISMATQVSLLQILQKIHLQVEIPCFNSLTLSVFLVVHQSHYID